ncbi:MAG: HTTM domain-containing protein [Fimbriimonadaceae bacterium]|nr:HTTM domain-containing protein [Fimbriimonadaceae bacterium]
MSAFTKFGAHLDATVFRWGSPTALGLFRIAFGSIATLNLLMILSQWTDWLTERGFFPAWMIDFYVGRQAQFAGREVPRVNVFLINLDPGPTLALLLIYLAVSILFTIGRWTKPVSILFAILTVSFQHRTSMILHGGDTVLRVYALYAALSPCGAACSLDRLVALGRGQEGLVPPRMPLWTQSLISFNVTLIYFTTVWIKWGGSMWRDGVATYYPNRLGEFERFPVPPFLIEFPMVRVTTYATLLTEFAFVSFVYYRPFRNYAIAAGLLMHSYIEYSMNIPIFAFLMMSGYLSFYDGEEFQRWARRMGDRMARWRVTVPLPSGLSESQRNVLRAVDPFGLVEYVEGDAPNAAQRRAAAVRSIGAWVLAWVPGVWASLFRVPPATVASEVPA